MKFKSAMQRAESNSARCSAIVQPGEYMTDRWDNKQCEETSRHLLIKCSGPCGELYCIWGHWALHLRNYCEV